MAEQTWQQKALEEYGKKLQSGQVTISTPWANPNPVPAPQAPTTTAPATSMSIPSSNVPAPQYTADQQAHQAWINNAESGQGGMDDYTSRQNQRWAEANTSGDADLMNRLKADSERVGYTLNPVPKPQSVMSPPQPMTMSASTPAPQAPNTISQTALQNQAASEIAKRRAAVSQSVASTLSNLKNTYDYQNQVINDRRSLENNTFQRQNNPFSGKTDYLAADMARTRSQQDTAMNKDYSTQVTSAAQKLADFDALAPEQQQSIYNDLLRIERDYGLQVGQLTGNFQGQRTLAGSAQDANFTGMYNGQQTMQAQNQAFQQQLALAELMGQMNGQSTLAGKQANLNAALQVGQQMGQVVTPQNDWSQLYNQNGAPNYQAQQDAIKNGQWQKTFEENVRQFGLDYALKQLQAQNSMANANADNTRQDRALQLQIDNTAWNKDPKNPDNQYKNAQISNLKDDNIRADTKNKIDNLAKLYTAKDSTTGEISVVNSSALRNAIIASGNSEDEIDKMLLYFGLQPN